MMNFASLESQFIEYYRDLERAVFANDYEKAIEFIRKALECCKRLYEESIDKNSKDKWKANAEKLQKIYSDCKIKLKESNIEYKPKVAPQKELDKKEEKIDNSKTYENVNYVIDGIDVKPFLTITSNDYVTFDDVCGMEDEKKKIINEFFLSDEKRKFLFEHLKKKNKNFILLYGVPGTGKTFFAKAISNELKLRSKEKEIPFFSVECMKMRDSKVGASEKNIQAVFEFSKQFENCVLFFDEFDAIVPDRGKETGDPTAKTNVDTFLQMLDGFSSSKGTLVIAATNCPYDIDGGILSRANEKIEIPLPVKEVIKKMLEKKIGSILEENVDLDKWSEKLVGYSSRDIDHLVEKLKDYVSEIYDENPNHDYSYYKITNKMIEKGIMVIKPSTKKSDLLRIKAYNESYN